MEMFELKYFLAVAQIENLNKAAENIHVSSGSLSKAISRLEEELQTPLFFKSGRGIKLTPEGLLLKKRAIHIIQLEEDARFELMGREIGSLNISISSEEILQNSYGIELAKKITSLYPKSRIQFLIRTEKDTIQQVMDGDAHFALITTNPPREAASKILGKVNFKTCASKKHPLFKKYGSKMIPIEELLKYPFISPDEAILGKIVKSSSTDGWRDDKFPRQVRYKVCGLKLMEGLIGEGMALGYLPDYFIENSHLVPLEISECPYTCHQTVRVIAKDPKALGWMNMLWDQF